MTIGQAIIVAVIAALVTALLATIGWATTRVTSRGDSRELRDAQTYLDVQQAKRDVQDLLGRAGTLERRTAVHGEELAALGAIMDRHEKWHERHDPTGDGSPPHRH